MLSSRSIAMPSGALMPVMKTDAAPALPLALTGIWMIWWNAVLATKRVLPSLENSTPLAPNGGVNPVPGLSNGLFDQAVGAPPLGPTFQITPLNESEM